VNVHREIQGEIQEVKIQKRHTIHPLARILGIIRARIAHNPRLLLGGRIAKWKLQQALEPWGITLPNAAYPLVTHQITQDLQQLLDDADGSLFVPDGTPRILFYSPRMFFAHLVAENILAHALSLRGATCFFATCAAHLPVCNQTNIHFAPPMPCKRCIAGQHDIINKSGFPNHTLREFLPEDSHFQKRIYQTLQSIPDAKLEDFTYDNLPMGKLVQLSVRRFLLGHSIESYKTGFQIYRDFLYGAILAYESAKRLVDETKPDIIFLLNGLFMEERMMLLVAQHRSLPFVTYERGFTNNTFVFARNKLANYFDLSEHWDTLSSIPLTPEQDAWLDSYLNKWKSGDSQSVKYWISPVDSLEEIRRRIGLPEQVDKIIPMFTNVVWDTAVQEKERIFDSIFDWVFRTLEFFQRHPDCHIVLRVHPAEVRLFRQETTEPLLEHITERLSQIPENVSLVSADSDISSYRLIEHAHIVLVYTSTIGLEAALSGKTVITAANTHYQQKGFTIDPQSQDAYFTQLDQLINTPSHALKPVDVHAARRYAYLFFHRYMVQIEPFNQIRPGNIRMEIEHLKDLQPGHFPQLDAICDFLIQTRENLNPEAHIQ
jgi:hypothetical protein